MFIYWSKGIWAKIWVCVCWLAECNLTWHDYPFLVEGESWYIIIPMHKGMGIIIISHTQGLGTAYQHEYHMYHSHIAWTCFCPTLNNGKFWNERALYVTWSSHATCIKCGTQGCLLLLVSSAGGCSLATVRGLRTNPPDPDVLHDWCARYLIN